MIRYGNLYFEGLSVKELEEKGIIKRNEDGLSFSFRHFYDFSDDLKSISAGTISSRAIRSLALYGKEEDKVMAAAAEKISFHFKEDYNNEYISKETFKANDKTGCKHHPELTYLEYGRLIVDNVLKYGYCHYNEMLYAGPASDYKVRELDDKLSVGLALDESTIKGQNIEHLIYLAQLVEKDIFLEWDSKTNDTSKYVRIRARYSPNGRVAYSKKK